jgi:hypothetical protein
MAKKRTEPGRAPWMSDAGYASSLRAATAAPEIAKHASCRVLLKCPHCGHRASFEFQAETCPSDGCESALTCEACSADFFVDAVLDVVVRATSEWT